METSPPSWLDDGMRHIWRPYCQMKTALPPIPVERASGSRLFLSDGRVLVDGIASWWTACHGYNHVHIANALRRQIEIMPHVMFGGLVHEPALNLARRLAQLLPGDLDRVFFSDSGSVAVEVAMKMAIQYWLNRGERRRTRIVAFHGAYHGDTFGTMAVCDPVEGMHALFRGVLPEQIVTALPQSEETVLAFENLMAREAGSIAAILVEPLVQGAGGMLFHDASVLATLREIATRYGCLLIFDEIFTGFGRSGAMFACIGAGVTPDIVTLSKALTGGTLALAATIASSSVFEGFWSDEADHALMHGPTFMANPLACAAANASLDLFETEPRLAQVAAIESGLKEGLAPSRGRPGIADVRVLGAIGVVELEKIRDLEALRARFVGKNVWIRPFGKIVYLTPALSIDKEDLRLLTTAVCEVAAEEGQRLS
ncbi:MAG: adenosylmethionine--8-amino-7-oxononanoate transaminase [Beijerinckiaceae bacterium]|nr:adenosylmethionine--8-amino-7-oxononanoate transaminase [Beijerinckiaceae bacterium]